MEILSVIGKSKTLASHKQLIDGVKSKNPVRLNRSLMS